MEMHIIQVGQKGIALVMQMRSGTPKRRTTMGTGFELLSSMLT
jgi:hypothetical protein